MNQPTGIDLVDKCRRAEAEIPQALWAELIAIADKMKSAPEVAFLEATQLSLTAERMSKSSTMRWVELFDEAAAALAREVRRKLGIDNSTY